MKKALVLADGYGGSKVYDASTPDKKNRAMLTVLRERFREGYYVEPQSNETPEMKEYLAMSEESISALPESFRKTVRFQIDQYRHKMEQGSMERKIWDMLYPMCTMPFEEAVKYSAESGVANPKSEYILSLAGGDDLEDVWDIVEISPPEKESPQ